MHHAHIDRFAYQDSWFHRLDSRAKLGGVLAFTALVIALPGTSLAWLLWAAAGPFAVLVWAGIPLRFTLKHVAWTSPFILVLALSSMFYHTQPMQLQVGPWLLPTTTGQWRACTIVIKFFITMSALIALVSTTRFNDLLAGLQHLHVPEVLVIQLGFLYRYIYILIDTAHHMLRARAARRCCRLGFRQEIRLSTAMIGSLLVRSLAHAERISIAMQARGFCGHWPHATRQQWSRHELYFCAGSLGYMVVLLLCYAPIPMR
ncbi:cobalt ECF transporter T component CbiQ [Planctomycetota bacterium]